MRLCSSRVEKPRGGESLSTRSKRLLFWAPRVLCILFAVFVSLFALDVFGEGYGFWETILALLIHLVPTYVILILLAIAWRWEWVGAILFGVLGVWYILMTRGRVPWTAYLAMSGPLFLIGVLFQLNWVYRRACPEPGRGELQDG